LFSFERYNGLLEKYHTYQLSIEIQIMRQFINDMSVRNSSMNSIALNNEEEILFGQLIRSNTSNETLYNQDCQFGLQTNLSISEENLVPSLEYLDNINVKLLPPFVLNFFDLDELQYVQQSYALFIPGVGASKHIGLVKMVT